MRGGGWWLKFGAYVLSLYAWWSVCSSYFEPEVVAVHRKAEFEDNYGATPASSIIAAPTAAETPGIIKSGLAEQATVIAAKPVVHIPATAANVLKPAAQASVLKAAAALPIKEAAAVAPTNTAGCPAGRRPYHTLLTAQGTIYNQWQARIMYHHWKKQREADGPCTEMSALTRLCPSKDGEPDGVEAYIPTIFVKQLTPEVLAKYGHFGVLNRPHSVVEFFKNPELRARVTEEYVLIAETDHVLTKPMPNLATETEAAAHSFGYMHAGSHHQKVIDLVTKDCTYKDLQPIGPSPLIIKIDDLEKVAPRWLEYSYALRGDPMPARLIQDWVLEMWGYSIAAASVGIRHKIIGGYQIEPNAYARTSENFYKDHYIFHYTYGIEYKLTGQPQGFNTIGEWSLDKRHYGGAYPPPNLDPPPDSANPSSRWLWHAWNSAIIAAGDTWPDTNAMGTIGWRRESITSAEIRNSPLATKVLGTEWLWAGIKSMIFNDAGILKTPWGEGKWGLAMRPKGMPQCLPPNECLFVDFSGAAHHVRFALPSSFTSIRVGDGELVNGTRIQH